MESMELQIARCAVETELLKDEEIWDAQEIQKLCREMNLKLPLSQIILKKYLPKPEHRNIYLTYIIDTLEILQIREYLDPYMMELGSFWEEAIASEYNDLRGIDLTLAQKAAREFRDFDMFVSVPYILILQNIKKWDSKNNIPYSSISRKTDLESFCERNRGKNLLPLNSSIHQLARSILSIREVEKAIEIQKKLEEKKFSIPIIHILIERYSLEAYLLHALLLSQIYCEHNSVQIRWNDLCLQKIRMPAGFIPKIKAAQIECAEFLQWSFKLSWLHFSPKEQLEILKILEKKVSRQKWNECVDISNNLQERKLPLSLLKILALSYTVSQEDLLSSVLSAVYKVPDSKISQALQNCEENFLKDTEEEYTEEQPSTEKASDSESIRSKETSVIKVAPYSKDMLGQTMAISATHLKRKRPKKGAETEEIKASETKALESKMVEAKVLDIADQEKSSSRISVSEDMLRIRMALQEKALDINDLVRVLWDRPEEQGKSLWNTLREKDYITQKNHDDLSQRPLLPIQSPIAKGSNPKDLQLSQVLSNYNMLTREQLQSLFRLQNTLRSLDASISLEELILKTKLIGQEILIPLIERQNAIQKESISQPLKETSRVERANVFNKLRQTMQVQLPESKKKTKRPLVYSVLALIALCLVWFILSPQPLPKKILPEKNNDLIVQKPAEPVTPVSPKDTQPQQENKTKEEVKASPEIAKETIKTIPPTAISLETAKVFGEQSQILVQGKFSIEPPLQEKIKIQCSLWDSRRKNKTGEQWILSGNAFSFAMTKIPLPLEYGFYYVRLFLPPEEKMPLASKENEWWIPFTYGTASEIKRAQALKLSDSQKKLRKIQELHQDFLAFVKRPEQEARSQWKSFSSRWDKRMQNVISEMEEYHRKSWISWDVYFSKEMLSWLEQMQTDYRSFQDWMEALSLILPSFSQKGFGEYWQREIGMEQEYQTNLLLFLEQK